ncbi:MAG: acetylglutamate kinase [Stygiobacter sp. RIFOXYC12_FULL_38_8]|nr:MAG: acetylglutamate kinase [Stygiobacter sp. GWC2_38_9]OGU85644.1 MAG: acetylglutamate kinase [Stygiobacter sp. RIFOXYA12_FULL_38_9]OGV07838.1 MAG: acetylglutamate kinase [Stygiobacter sp. RIFOXYB2_FULL_37_11]OGV11702.1 MAG: acetylglutamate kinase [Stygiobacter sp. RIFOXYA2_FULL_38_8]OGV12841.1 MAG: acetylglutamate kinase [Stygiobacter sp. RIFOXYC2_FULL_38_25]OGV27098.1 MAG: acetylglutamate kinase [Stygiobacter sp. RIFOXYC12_FULL_38_8]OGV81902.1 MAG: acetylglutamate kinase [Stygiobacter s
MTKPVFRKEDVLIEALPYIQQFEKTTFVIKYGGAVMTDENLKAMVAQDVTLLRKIGIEVVVVHGGGKEITSLAEKLDIKTKFVNGQRYTDEDMRDVVQMVLGGLINKDIVRRININGGRAVGISGIDANLVTVKQLDKALGLVGEVIDVNASFIRNLLNDGYLPVIAPIGVDAEGTIFNVNADIAAGPIAASLSATKLVYMTDIDGVKINGKLASHLTQSEAQKYIADGTISGGMIPKVESALAALESGVQKVHIIDGRVEHALLLEIFTQEGIGTEIVSE